MDWLNKYSNDISKAQTGINIPRKPVQNSKQSKGEFKAALKQYNLNLHKYELENNPNRIKGETDLNYTQRQEYNKFRVDQVENKNPVKKWYNEMDASQEADHNYVTKTIRKVGTSPIHIANYIDDLIDIPDTQKYKNTNVKSHDLIKGVGSAIDLAGLVYLPSLDLGLKKTAPVAAQVLNIAATQFFNQGLQDVGTEKINNITEKVTNKYIDGGIVKAQQGKTIAKNPVYVDSKNDPRYKAYQDSLSLYDKTLKNLHAEKTISKSKIINKGFIPFNKFDNFVTGSNLEVNDGNRYPGDVKIINGKIEKINGNKVSEKKKQNLIKNNIAPIGFDINEWKSSPTAKSTINYSTIYKKPTQPVLIQERDKINPIENTLQPIGIQNNSQEFETDLNIRQITSQPKYYNITDKVNQKFGGSESNYRFYPEDGKALKELSEQKYEDGSPYNERTMTPVFQNGGTVDMYDNEIKASIQNKDIPRSYYDGRTETIVTGEDYQRMLPQQQAKLITHENRHHWQQKNDRTNFNITHNPDYSFEDRLQKKPVITNTDEVWNKYNNRKSVEIAYDLKKLKKFKPDFQFIPDDLLYDKIIDDAQYSNPKSMEGEAQYYENTGNRSFQDGGTIKDNNGYWNPKNYGKVVEIDQSNPDDFITMKGVDQNLIGISDTGDMQFMTPGNDYKFEGKKVREFPIAKNGRVVNKNWLDNY